MINNILILIIILILIVIVILFIYNKNETCNYMFINDTDVNLNLSVLLVNNYKPHISSIINSKKDMIMSLDKNKVYDISLINKNDILPSYNYLDNSHKVIGDKIIYTNNHGKIILDHNIKNNNITNELKELKIINNSNIVQKLDIRVTYDMVMYIIIDKNSEIVITDYLILSAIYKNYLHRPVTVMLYEENKYNLYDINNKNISLLKGYTFINKDGIINMEINNNNKINLD